ncbi:hypothetical protein ACFQVD_40055 [Streptosporangium amethystogenes subsp. fukuiense]|uniref:Uncharacterized protein n=1 Tax=Streptosporangium amethystogenes subsp. fukuiense TaxID=698418 RepID=A0ABW2TDZ5_9ACTN
MAQDKYVTSSSIGNIQRNLGEKVIPGLRELKSDIDSTDVGFPGFGLIGALTGSKYSQTQDDIKNMVEDAITSVEAWIAALETIKKNWRAAEDASTVVYR